MFLSQIEGIRILRSARTNMHMECANLVIHGGWRECWLLRWCVVNLLVALLGPSLYQIGQMPVQMGELGLTKGNFHLLGASFGGGLGG